MSGVGAACEQLEAVLSKLLHEQVPKCGAARFYAACNVAQGAAGCKQGARAACRDDAELDKAGMVTRVGSDIDNQHVGKEPPVLNVVDDLVVSKRVDSKQLREIVAPVLYTCHTRIAPAEPFLRRKQLPRPPVAVVQWLSMFVLASL